MAGKGSRPRYVNPQKWQNSRVWQDKYTVDEIREWLEGWKCTDGAGNPAPSLPLETILLLLDCEQDGIKAWFNRTKNK